MKKNFIPVLLAAALMGGTFTSCIGSFALFNKTLAWNNQIGGKVVNELVFLAFWIVPVYEVCALADILVINSIEFWSGDNPMAQGTRVIDGKDGRYLVACDGKGYTIKSENDGSEVRLNFDEADKTWSAVLPSGQEMELVTFIDDTHVALPAADGAKMTVEISDEGLMAYRQAAAQGLWAAK